MSKLKGSRTEENLLAAFAGESQARNRYTFYAGVARKEGYRQIEALFLETAENELAHAKRFFKFLEGGMVEITASYPAGVIGSTVDNLKEAAEGENEEHSQLYPEAARVAEEEGFTEIASTFRNIAKVEVKHEARFLKLLNNIEKGEVFRKDAPVAWKCRNCGHIHEGAHAPDMCPACIHPQEHFELFVETY